MLMLCMSIKIILMLMSMPQLRGFQNISFFQNFFNFFNIFLIITDITIFFLDLCEAITGTHMLKKSGPKRFRLFILNEKYLKKNDGQNYLQARITRSYDICLINWFLLKIEFFFLKKMTMVDHGHVDHGHYSPWSS